MTFYSTFDKVGKFITSMAIVIILLVPFMWYRYYEFNTLFMKWLPIANESDRGTPALLISVVFICITLLFMVNTHRLFSWINYLLAGTSFTLNLFFWSLKVDHNIWFILFISAVIASMDYGLAHLFDKMWKEKGQGENLSQIKDRIKNQKAKLDKINSEIEAHEAIMADYYKVLEKCHCEPCGRTFPTHQAKSAHKCITKMQAV